MWPFKRKPEPPQEIAAEQRLDQAVRADAWDELDESRKADAEAVRGSAFGPGASNIASAIKTVQGVEGEHGP
jgi:hypothetical protein